MFTHQRIRDPLVLPCVYDDVYIPIRLSSVGVHEAVRRVVLYVIGGSDLEPSKTLVRLVVFFFTVVRSKNQIRNFLNVEDEGQVPYEWESYETNHWVSDTTVFGFCVRLRYTSTG